MFTKKELADFDKSGDETDNQDGPISVGTLLYSKEDMFFMVVVGRSGFYDTVEVKHPSNFHFGISGYCYNMNIIRVPNNKLTDSDRQVIEAITRRYSP